MPQALVPEPLFARSVEFDESWKIRIAHLAKFIDTSGPVLDIGCGMMWLESQLVRRNEYIPLDYIRRDHRTLVVDLNTQSLPPINAEFAVMSGVLEYLHDVPAILHELIARRYRRILITYCTIECWWKMELRHILNWVSHLSLEDLLVELLPAYRIVSMQRIDKQVALVVELREM
jgi:hypothetical protein